MLTTDGSVTRILEALGYDVNIKAIKQEIVSADKKLSKELNISLGEPVNHRVVIIESKIPLIYAVSYMPIKRLNKNFKFKRDVMNANIPIGKILKKHHIESRREIEYIGVEKPNDSIKNIFNTNELILARTYNIIHRGEILIRINEKFPITWFK